MSLLNTPATKAASLDETLVAMVWPEGLTAVSVSVGMIRASSWASNSVLFLGSPSVSKTGLAPYESRLLFAWRPNLRVHDLCHLGLVDLSHKQIGLQQTQALGDHRVATIGLPRLYLLLGRLGGTGETEAPM